MTVPAGTRLGPYEVVTQIGAGGMGEVYRARDMRLDRTVAIKVLPAHLADKPELRERFQREARTIANLNHPHICVLYDIGRQDDTDFLVLEYLEGETLATRLVKGPLPIEQVLQYAIEIADALDKAHRNGITHRDLKPGNIMLTLSGTKLLDFGLAKLRQEAAPATTFSQLPTASVKDAVTQQGVILGTLKYMAPEQVEGKTDQIDARTDIFAFGAVVYEMATGKRAFEGKTSASVTAKILEVAPPSMASLEPMTPPGLDRVVKRCLAKHPDHRWQTASDLCEALKWIAGGASQPTPALEGASPYPPRVLQTEKPSSGKQAKEIDSLAVLPLENVSGDPEADYLSDGIAETLINSLSQLRKIRVAPRTLSFRYRGAGVDVLKAGRELGVRAILAGRMVQHGEGLLVSVELVDVDRQAQLWGSRYNRKMTDLIVLQEELATEIAEKLRLQLTGEEKKRLRKRPTQNSEPFRLVLQAQHYISGGSPEGLSKGIALCHRAIEIDPTYAVAYARVSFAHSIQLVLEYADPAEVAPRMLAAAKKALELDDTLADAHVGLGWSLFYRWDFSGAEREARRSVELNPDATEAWNLLDFVVLSLGRFEDAIAAGKRAVEVAPFDYFPAFALGVTYLHAQQFEHAIEQLRKTADIDPGSPPAHGALAHAYASAGQHDAAIDECELALALNRKDAFLVLHAATGYAMAGESGKARKLAEEVEKNWKADGASAFWLAAVHAYLGEKDTAFEWLERAFEVRAPFLVFLSIMWTHHLLRGDPRFDALVKRIGIPH